MELTLARGTLRPWRRGDEPSLVLHANNRSVWLNLRDRFPHPYTAKDADEWIAHAGAQAPVLNFAIVVAGAAVGGTGLTLGTDVSRRSAAVGYWLGPPFWGRGIATEGLWIADLGGTSLSLARQNPFGKSSHFWYSSTMSAAARWQVDDYRGAGGARPVKAFLDGLSDDPKAKAYAALEMLAEMGNALRFPRSRALGDGLFELRVSFGDGTMRLIYEYQPGRRIVLLHAFVKKTQQTPHEDLALAKSRMAERGN